MKWIVTKLAQVSLIVAVFLILTGQGTREPWLHPLTYIALFLLGVFILRRTQEGGVS